MDVKCFTCFDNGSLQLCTCNICIQRELFIIVVVVVVVAFIIIIIITIDIVTPAVQIYCFKVHMIHFPGTLNATFQLKTATDVFLKDIPDGFILVIEEVNDREFYIKGLSQTVALYHLVTYMHDKRSGVRLDFLYWG